VPGLGHRYGCGGTAVRTVDGHTPSRLRARTHRVVPAPTFRTAHPLVIRVMGLSGPGRWFRDLAVNPGQDYGKTVLIVARAGRYYAGWELGRHRQGRAPTQHTGTCTMLVFTGRVPHNHPPT